MTVGSANHHHYHPASRILIALMSPLSLWESDANAKPDSIGSVTGWTKFNWTVHFIWTIAIYFSGYRVLIPTAFRKWHQLLAEL